MARHAAISTLCSAIAATSVSAQEWQVNATLSQGFTASNRINDFDNNNGSLQSTTNIGIQARTGTPITTLNFSTGFRLLGRSDANGDQQTFEAPLPFFNGQLARRLPRSNYSLSARIDPEFVSARAFSTVLVEDLETGEFTTDRVARNEDPLQIDLRLDGRANFNLDTRNRLNANAALARREYDETSDNFQPTTRITLGGGWDRSISPVETAGVTASLRYFNSDRADADDTLATTLRGRYNASLTTRHNMTLSAGPAFSNIDDSPTVRFSGSGALNYAAPRANYRVSLDQDIRQDDDGDIENVLSLRGNANYRLTDTSSLQIGARASLSAPLEDTISTEADQRFTLSSSYTRRLAEDWSLNVGLGVNFNRDADQDDIDGDGRVFLRITRSFQILP